MTKKIAVILADGFEEIEAVVPSDVLKRLGCEVIHAGAVSKTVTGAHGFRIEAACTLNELDPDFLDAVFLPGGLPGATNLRDNPDVIELLRKLHAEGKILSAICAAPIVLHKAGVTSGRRITGYPGSEKWLPDLNTRGPGQKTTVESLRAKAPALLLILPSLLPKLSVWRRKNFNN